MKKTQRTNRHRGRPEGSRSVQVKSGLSLHENFERAIAGEPFGNDGKAFASMLLALAHRSWKGVPGFPQSFAQGFGEEVLQRLVENDIQFFRDFLERLEREYSGRWPDDKYRALLLALAKSRPAGELLVVPRVREYLKEGGVRKSDTAIRRDLRLLAIPFARGKPGRLPAPRRAHKRRRISLAGLKQSAAAGFNRFLASRPEMHRRKKSDHIG